MHEIINILVEYAFNERDLYRARQHGNVLIVDNLTIVHKNGNYRVGKLCQKKLS